MGPCLRSVQTATGGGDHGPQLGRGHMLLSKLQCPGQPPTERSLALDASAAEAEKLCFSLFHPVSPRREERHPRTLDITAN